VKNKNRDPKEANAMNASARNIIQLVRTEFQVAAIMGKQAKSVQKFLGQS
jgi:hypothetical protein